MSMPTADFLQLTVLSGAIDELLKVKIWSR